MSELEAERAMEHLQEQIAHEIKAVEGLKEELHHQQAEESQDRRWISQVAVSTGILAALAAISAMRGNFLANEAMIAEVRAADQWSFFQAKSTKRHIQQSTATLLQSFDKPIPASITADIERLEQEQKGIETEARMQETEAKALLEGHELFAYSVAALQVSISVGAVATLMRRRGLWFVSLAIAMVGVGFMISGFVPKSHSAGEHAPPAAETSH